MHSNTITFSQLTTTAVQIQSASLFHVALTPRAFFSQKVAELCSTTTDSQTDSPLISVTCKQRSPLCLQGQLSSQLLSQISAFPALTVGANEI